MSIRNMDSLFEPGSVAIFGASLRPDRMGTQVMNNMAESGFAGAIWPVNPKYEQLRGIPCYARLSALPRAPDLAIICTPPDTVPGLIADLGARGTRGAIILTPVGDTVRQQIMRAARPYLLRILGPGGIGLVAPLAGLNASAAHAGAKPGKTAFISQSATVMTAVLDWAQQHGIGFSRVVSVVEGGDIDLGDMLDYLAEDDDTSAIIMHLESVTCARKFISAARLAARSKPVVVLKAGRSGDDKVYDAVIHRAGMLRVYSSADLFDAVETVARARPTRGTRLAIMSNGSGTGKLAADALQYVHGKLAQFSPDTGKRLRNELPQGLLLANPIDIGGEASAERHVAVASALLADPGADALLIVHAPSSAAASTGVAQALAPLLRQSGRSVLSCWLGGASVAGARQVFADAGLPSYDTPEKAVRAYSQVVQYARNQALLIEVPGQVPAHSVPERQSARNLVQSARAAGHAELAPAELAAVLAAYGLPLAGEPAGGNVQQLRIAMQVDPVFGPAISVGLGGSAGRVVDDRAVGLPPLNTVLARDMLRRTGVGRALVDEREILCGALVHVAELVADIGEIAALEVDPVTVVDGVLQVHGARATLGPRRAESSMAIRPYPQELEQEIRWQGAPLLLRPIRPEDAPAHVRFFSRLDPDDVRLRFFSAMKELPPTQLARLTQIDYDRAMAFIATRSGADGQPETLGVVRAVADPDNQKAEFAIIVRSDLKGKGLGNILFQKLLDYFRSRGTREITGEALSENIGMQQLMRRFGGTVTASQEAGMVDLRLALDLKTS
ncbi:acetyl-CoA synthetase (ADP-forming)/acetyltransferase [Duganella sp. CF458]|uniref:bifunctional acetate--CoA ligase family protein/GNAT family N-acetyltransferase n=1 Tax=Duganella sp. CF458 TaxID=1884368 RepID=UPI0008F06A17|nr:GNAT family N-acetyltransferase [Duganella sp. CF458]SFF94235.1 acetyl-CoA synthetase (ADP-forming)/acetyltransferase [Duganella sp. CF458]